MPRRREWTPDKLEWLEKMLKTHTQAEVGTKLGLSKSAIQMVCNRYGLTCKRTDRGYRPRDEKGRFTNDDRPRRDPFLCAFQPNKQGVEA